MAPKEVDLDAAYYARNNNKYNPNTTTSSTNNSGYYQLRSSQRTSENTSPNDSSRDVSPAPLEKSARMRQLASSTSSFTSSHGSSPAAAATAPQPRYKNYLQSGRLAKTDHAPPPPALQSEPKTTTTMTAMLSKQSSSISRLSDSSNNQADKNLKAQLESFYSDLLKEDEAFESDYSTFSTTTTTTSNYSSSFAHRDSLVSNAGSTNTSILSSPRISQAFDQVLGNNEALPSGYKQQASSTLASNKPWIITQTDTDTLNTSSSDDDSNGGGDNDSLDFENEEERRENFSQRFSLGTEDLGKKSPPLPPAPAPFVYLSSSTPRPKPRILDLSEEEPPSSFSPSSPLKKGVNTAVGPSSGSGMASFNYPSSTAPGTPNNSNNNNSSPASALSSAELRNRLRESKNDFQSRINAVKLSSALSSAASVTGNFNNSNISNGNTATSSNHPDVAMNDIHTANLVNTKVLADYYGQKNLDGVGKVEEEQQQQQQKSISEPSVAELEREILDLQGRLDEKVALLQNAKAVTAAKRSSSLRLIVSFIRRFILAALLVVLLIAADSGMRWVMANQQQANSLVAEVIVWIDGRLEEATQFAQSSLSKHLPEATRLQVKGMLEWIQQSVFGGSASSIEQQPY